MVVKRQKFLDAVDYIREINSHELDELDLSDFTKRKLSKKEIEKWKFTGLSNRDFIAMMEDNDWKPLEWKKIDAY
jgi:hypothetical protein